MNWKSALRPRGWHVPRRKMRRISCRFLCLLPSQSLIPRTSASAVVCPLELKCSATGKPGAVLLMLRRCSPNRSLRVRPVSPMVVIERTVACMRFREHVEVIYLTFFTYPLERLDAWNLIFSFFEVRARVHNATFKFLKSISKRGFNTLTNIPLKKGTVPKRLDLCYHFGTFYNI